MPSLSSLNCNNIGGSLNFQHLQHFRKNQVKFQECKTAPFIQGLFDNSHSVYAPLQYITTYHLRSLLKILHLQCRMPVMDEDMVITKTLFLWSRKRTLASQAFMGHQQILHIVMQRTQATYTKIGGSECWTRFCPTRCQHIGFPLGRLRQKTQRRQLPLTVSWRGMLIMKQFPLFLTCPQRKIHVLWQNFSIN